MSDNGRPFDFGQFGGASAPGNAPSPAGASGSANPFGAVGADGADRNVYGGSTPAGFGTGMAVGGGHYDGGSAPLRPTNAPVVWLYAAVAASIIAMLVALLLGSTAAFAIGAWILAGPIAIALVAVFSIQDTRARTAALYSSSGFVSWLYRGAIVLSLIAVVISALKIADWVGRI
ncbi:MULTISPECIES: hypothetical protein [Arthrobacter]|uniref:Uncharacterized protein n=1 Tax=Arthrobacter psychrochitiniphilus TaxID=291045 RepID=A0A2V3DTX2_9MICC|nr:MULTISPECIES: hypothetical protein [Arthrobacter]NYG19155.1 hypothetical protein [Arthrobacter psychrochitiniphilus]PXA65891.1 hypothetical protein CVS29_07690 [Arthrobacter psychrochitiniphilus]